MPLDCCPSPERATAELWTDPPIAPEASSPQQPGSEFWVDVRVGSESNSVENLNQIGFDLSFEQQPLSHVADEAGSFLGDVQYASNVDSDNGVVSVGATRTDDEGRSGSGVVARVRLAVGEEVAGGTELTFSIRNVRAEDPSDNSIDLDPQDLNITVQEQTPPDVSDVVLSDDGSGNLDFSFDSDEQLGSDASDIAVSIDGPNTSDVYSFDRTDFSESGSGPYTYELTTMQAYDDGTGTYTASVDDAVDPDGSDGADGTQTDSYLFEADITLMDGRDGESYSPPSPTPGTNDNPVGRFKLSAAASGSSLSNVTITQEESSDEVNSSDVNSIELWTSGDDAFDSGSDTEIASKNYADNVSFSGLSASIPTSGGYIFLVVDLVDDADGDYDPKIADEDDISFTEGALSNFNGTGTTSFTDAYLSSAPTPLPVELAQFDASVEEEEVVLKWRTTSETNNSGFHVQRRVPGTGTWSRLTFVDGAGTTNAPQTYRYRDADLPYEADSLTYRLKQVDAGGTSSLSEPLTVRRGASEAVKLLGTRPNPARSQSTVRYALPREQKITLRLFDALGRHVTTLKQGREDAGRNQLQLDTSSLSSSVYFLRLTAERAVKTERLTVVH